MRSGPSTEQLNNINDKLERVSNRELTSMSILPLDVMMAIVAAECGARTERGEPELTCKLIEVNEDQAHQQITPELIKQLSALNKERVLLIVKGQSHYTTIDFQFDEQGNSFVILDAARHATSLPIYDILNNLKKPNDPTTNFFDSAIIIGDPASRYDKVQTGYKGCSAFAAYMAFAASRLPDFHNTCAHARGNDPTNQPLWSSLPPDLIRYAQSPRWWSEYRAAHQTEAAQVGPRPGADKSEIETGIVNWVAEIAKNTADFLASKRHQLALSDPVDVDRRMIDILKISTNIAPAKSQANTKTEGASQHDTESINSSRELVEKLKSDDYVGNLTACAGLCAALNESGKLQTLFEDFYSLDEAFRYIEHQQIQEILCTALMNYLPDMLNNANSTPYCIGKVFPYLNTEQRNIVLEKLDHEKLANDISDSTDFMDVMSNIPAAACAKICEQTLSSQNSFFKTAKEFANTLNQLEGETCKGVVDGMKAAGYHFPNNDRLEDVLPHLHDSKRSLLESELKTTSTLNLK